MVVRNVLQLKLTYNFSNNPFRKTPRLRWSSFTRSLSLHWRKWRWLNPSILTQFWLFFFEGKGHFTHMSNPSIPPLTIHTNLTTHTTSFTLPTDEPCTLFIYMNSPPRIFCETKNQIELRQILPLVAYKVSRLKLSQTSALFPLRRHHSPSVAPST